MVSCFLGVLLGELFYHKLEIEKEPHLQPLDNKRSHLRSTVTSSGERLDIKAGGFWARGVMAFFDVRVAHINSKCYQSKPTFKVFNPLNPGAFCEKGVSWTFWWFLRWILVKLPLIWSKIHLHHHSLTFLPLASRFATFWLGHAQKSNLEIVFGRESDLCL